MRILVWHVHGGWMEAFVRGRHEYLLPVEPDGGPWGLGRGGRDWPDNAVEVHLATLDPDGVDAVVLQRPEEIAAVARSLGRKPGVDLPAVYLEHNTPKGDVPFTVHPMADQRTIPVVHVTHFNQLFWDTGSAATVVIEHGIPDPGRLYTGEREEMGIVVNEPVRRGRVTGTDLLPGFAGVGPLRVFGMGTEHLPGALNLKGLGLGEERLRIAGDVPASQLHAELARCRLYVHPLRWTSLGLALLEAMHLGMPVLALGTTEAYRAVPRGAGLVSTDVDELQRFARRLLNDPDDAYAMGLRAREAALERYGLDAFLRAWDELLGDLRTRGSAAPTATAAGGAPRSAPPSHDAERTHP
ncbi:glycosyltransferase [Paenarthrobacter sp. AT5]|uniref:glycosyltransferase n=1 Tax=Paenarthrobacter TaxID=1742992 RepID=UPI001A99113E|nr:MULTISPECIES: glycosyltransferase [Paenarthrobacter]QSZ52087.1 glycosyl transferase [Paenarthrobacter ureafaciens]WOC61178.1 glycosyltransferase [Paenarthrobacter sp. AT5]